MLIIRRKIAKKGNWAQTSVSWSIKDGGRVRVYGERDTKQNFNALKPKFRDQQSRKTATQRIN